MLSTWIYILSALKFRIFRSGCFIHPILKARPFTEYKSRFGLWTPPNFVHPDPDFCSSHPSQPISLWNWDLKRKILYNIRCETEQWSTKWHWYTALPPLETGPALYHKLYSSCMRDSTMMDEAKGPEIVLATVIQRSFFADKLGLRRRSWRGNEARRAC